MKHKYSKYMTTLSLVCVNKMETLLLKYESRLMGEQIKKQNDVYNFLRQDLENQIKEEISNTKMEERENMYQKQDKVYQNFMRDLRSKLEKFKN